METVKRKQSQVLNLERVHALETWLEKTNTKLTQVNGQRRYGGPPEVWSGPVPGARCEVFISHIPRDAYEDLLIPLFSSVGPLWEFRLMMNFSGQNRGFAYAKYGSAAVAGDAIRLLHGYMLEPGVCLGVHRSTEKRHLCIGDLPASTRHEDLLQVLQALTDGVERLSLKAGPGIEGVFAIVAFSSHYAASMAKKMLAEAFQKRFGLTVSVKWQSMLKICPEEPATPNKPPKNLVSTFKPPCRTSKSLQPSVAPPRLDRPKPDAPGFCRAVRRPAADKPPLPVPQELALAAVTPATRLRKLCESAGVGQPLYEMCYSHTAPDGLMHFNFKVSIPLVAAPFKGLVTVLQGPCSISVLQDAAAQQILQRFYHELSH